MRYIKHIFIKRRVKLTFLSTDWMMKIREDVEEVLPNSTKYREAAQEFEGFLEGEELNQEGQ